MTFFKKFFLTLVAASFSFKVYAAKLLYFEYDVNSCSTYILDVSLGSKFKSLVFPKCPKQIIFHHDLAYYTIDSKLFSRSPKDIPRLSHLNS